MTFHFKDVGRGKACWTEDLPVDVDGRVSASTLLRAIRRRKVLASRDIDFSEDAEGALVIYAGFRPVGLCWAAK